MLIYFLYIIVQEEASMLKVEAARRDSEIVMLRRFFLCFLFVFVFFRKRLRC